MAEQTSELAEAVREYLRARSLRRGHQQTAARCGVSRHTLWRFLWTDHVSPRLVASVTAPHGTSPRLLKWEANRVRRSGQPVASNVAKRGLSSVEQETLRLLCETPLTTVAESSSTTDMPATTLGERLVRMAKRGLIDSRPHRLAMLGERPQRRFFTTVAGIVALAGGEAQIQRVLQRYPVSKHWFRIFAERLDSVAVLYALAAMIGDIKAAAVRSRVQVEHRRSGPYDMLLRVSTATARLEWCARSQC